MLYSDTHTGLFFRFWCLVFLFLVYDSHGRGLLCSVCFQVLNVCAVVFWPICGVCFVIVHAVPTVAPVLLYYSVICVLVHVVICYLLRNAHLKRYERYMQVHLACIPSLYLYLITALYLACSHAACNLSTLS